MISLIQRVTEASVSVSGDIVGSIGPGLLALLAVEPGDTEAQADRMAERLAGYRVFDDGEGKMNLSLADTGGGLLLVPQFTLAADTSRGMRPSFTRAAPPELGRRLFDLTLERARARLGARVATGRFGAHMRVGLVNDGPVTLWIHVSPAAGN